jgi:hypothetical protein
MRAAGALALATTTLLPSTSVASLCLAHFVAALTNTATVEAKKSELIRIPILALDYGKYISCCFT